MIHLESNSSIECSSGQTSVLHPGLVWKAARCSSPVVSLLHSRLQELVGTRGKSTYEEERRSIIKNVHLKWKSLDLSAVVTFIIRITPSRFPFPPFVTVRRSASSCCKLFFSSSVKAVPYLSNVGFRVACGLEI